MIVVIKDLYTLKSWEDQDTESLAFHLNNKKIWDNCRDGLPYPYTKVNARFFIKQAQEKTDISDFCITVGGEAIGNIGFVRGTDVERFNAGGGYCFGCVNRGHPVLFRAYGGYSYIRHGLRI